MGSSAPPRGARFGELFQDICGPVGAGVFEDLVQASTHSAVS